MSKLKFDIYSLKERIDSLISQCKIYLKEPIDSLISQCKVYVKKYLSKSDLNRFEKSYREAKFLRVYIILRKTLEQIKTKIMISEDQKTEKKVRDNEGGQNENMEIGMITAVSVIILTILALISMELSNILKIKVNNKTIGEIISLKKQKNNNSSKSYTEKDREKNRDMMELIHELSTIYDNTERYRNS